MKLKLKTIAMQTTADIGGILLLQTSKTFLHYI